MTLNDCDAQKGVCAHSSGNHAIAVAMAAKRKGIPSTIIVPNTAPMCKRKLVEETGSIYTP